MSASDSPLLVRREGPILHLTFNRPERRNALSLALVEQFDGVIEALPADHETRVVVIGGAGGHFCAGLDLSEARPEGTPEARLAAQRERNRRTAARYAALAALPQVVIARVSGAAYAGGLGFVATADIAIADESARFAAPEVRRGLVPAQILPWLAHRMGRSAAGRMVLQAHVLDARQALAGGLIHEVVADAAALEAAVDRTINDCLLGAPGAIAETKLLLRALGDPVSADYAEAGAAAFARAASGEAAEGIAAFKEKRPPSWAPVPR